MSGTKAPAARLHHVAIWTNDLVRSLEFYTEGLGLRELFRSLDPGVTVFLGTDEGPVIELFEHPGFVPVLTPDEELPLSRAPERMARIMVEHGVQFHFCMNTDDVDAAAGNACLHGARIVLPPHDSTLRAIAGEGEVQTRYAFIEGPNGEWIEFLRAGPIPPVG